MFTQSNHKQPPAIILTRSLHNKMAADKRIFRVVKPKLPADARFKSSAPALAASKAATRHFNKSKTVSKKNVKKSTQVEIVDVTPGRRTENKRYKYRVTRTPLTRAELNAIPSKIGFIPQYKTTVKSIKN